MQHRLDDLAATVEGLAHRATEGPPVVEEETAEREKE